MASDNLLLKNSYDLGRVECPTNITNDEKRHYKPVSKSKAKENTNIQISSWQGFSTSILDVILSGKQDLMCVFGFYISML